MTVLLAAVVLMAAACDRNKTPDLVHGAGAPAPNVANPPPPEAVPTAKSPAQAGGNRAQAKAAPAHPRPSPGSSRARRSTGSPVADDPCSGLDGAELDDCLGFESDTGVGDADRSGFTDRQRERDRALLERDAREAAERAQAGDEPPLDDGEPIDPQEDLPPDDYHQGAENGYDSGDDEPPPDDDAGW